MIATCSSKIYFSKCSSINVGKIASALKIKRLIKYNPLSDVIATFLLIDFYSGVRFF
jgi:hypothetical protein